MGKMPKFKFDIRDMERGYPNAQPVFRNIKEKGFIYVSGSNMFVAENKAEKIWKKMKNHKM